MRKIEKLRVEYVGYKNPETLDEAEMEILGLETAIRGAQQRVAMLKQSMLLNKMMKDSVVDDNEETVEKADSTVEDKQTQQTE
jgi:hypothetical protein